MNFSTLCKKFDYARTQIKLDAHEIALPSSEKPYVIYEPNCQNVSLKGQGTLSLSTDKTLTYDKSLCLEVSTTCENIVPRPSSTISFALNNIDFSKYNYFQIYVYVEATGYEGFYFHFMTGNPGFYTNHAPIIYPNKWQRVVYNCKHITRDNVSLFSITPFLMGTPPEALAKIKVYIDSICAFSAPDIYDEGFELQDRIAFSHPGYFINKPKNAIVSKTLAKKFTLVDDITKEQYLFNCSACESKLGLYTILDFSSFNKKGLYHLEIDNIKSESFIIDSNPFNSAILKSLNFLRLLRCGEHIEGVHTKCHLNCKTYDSLGKTVPNFGGWHDAGDLSQFEIPTAEITSSLLSLAKEYNKNMKKRILEESKIGLDWLLQTRFKDGFRAMAVTYGFWRDNLITSDNKQVLTNIAEKGAFENFLSSIALLKGYFAFKNTDEIYSRFLLRSGLEDLNFALSQYENNIYTVRWGEPIISQTSGAALVSLCLAYKITKDKMYLDNIYKYVKDVLYCQETSDDINGFFYEDPDHKYILCYEHRGHEEYPILGLIEALKYVNALVKQEILNALNLYANYIKTTTEYTYPYSLLPAQVYLPSKINYNHFTIRSNECLDDIKKSFTAQIMAGFKLSEDYYLRIMPISHTRRGFLATNLSKTKGVSALANLLGDEKLHNIALRQIEFTLGLNPFSSSLMYGEGYRNHPLYVAFSKQMIGSLPVGIKTNKEHDLPYWPCYTNAVFKEIWGHTTGKFLDVLSDILRWKSE